MIIHPKPIGIVACCGSECQGGYISRAVAANIVNELRREQAVTLSLPRLLIGTTPEKEFSKRYPTIAVDGCSNRCAQKALEKYCFKPIVGINIGDVLGESSVRAGIDVQQPYDHRHMSDIGKVTGIVTQMVDSLAAMYEKATASSQKDCSQGSCDCGCSGSSCDCGCSSENTPVSEPATMQAVTQGIVIYTKSGCPFCAKVLQEYREQGITFQEVNTSTTPGAKQLCKDQYGADKVPLIVKNGVVIQIGDVEGKG